MQIPFNAAQRALFPCSEKNNAPHCLCNVATTKKQILIISLNALNAHPKVQTSIGSSMLKKGRVKPQLPSQISLLARSKSPHLLMPL